MRTNRYTRRNHRTPLSRNPDRAALGGVCAGVARFLGIAPLPVRLATILGLFIWPHVFLLAYGLAFLVLDPIRDKRGHPEDDWDLYD